MGFGMSLLMTLIITYINTGMDSDYYKRFLKWILNIDVSISFIFFNIIIVVRR